jgi:hypothetical protein
MTNAIHHSGMQRVTGEFAVDPDMQVGIIIGRLEALLIGVVNAGFSPMDGTLSVDSFREDDGYEVHFTWTFI